jgi:RNA polymerase sigma-70 factor (ECF subfamily)
MRPSPPVANRLEALTPVTSQDERPDEPASSLQAARDATDRQWSDWMAAAQGGDRAAYNRLLRAIVPLITRIARRQGVEGAAADDVVQEVLSSIHRARHTYDPSRSFTAWVTTIAQRRAIDIMRRQARHSARERHAPLAYEAYADPGMETDRPLDEAERARILGEAISGLAEGQREAVEHLAIRELSLAEASRLTGKSKGALRVNLHRAMKTLRSRLGGRI